MPIVNFNELNPGTKFTFDETDGSWVKIRAYNDEIMTRIRKECVKKEAEYRAAKKHAQLQRIEYQTVDDERMRHLLWDYVVMAWGGFLDENSKEIPCTTDNKILFMSQWPTFNQFVDKCLAILTPDVEAEVKESEKN